MFMTNGETDGWAGKTWWHHQMETFSTLLAFVRGIHHWPVNSRTKASDAELWCFLCTWINGWVNNHEAGDLRCHHAHYDITVMMHCQVAIPVSIARDQGFEYTNQYIHHFYFRKYMYVWDCYGFIANVFTYVFSISMYKIHILIQK